jgi:hypothetical protein
MSYIDEIKQAIYFKKLYKENVIDLDNYFKYSGKQEYNNNLVDITPEYRAKVYIRQMNDMNKYKLKK